MQPEQSANPSQSPDQQNADQPSQSTPEAPASTWQYGDSGTDSQSQSLDMPVVSWSASEYIEHDKQATWFIALGMFAIVCCAIIYLLTQDTVTTGAVGIAIVLFGITASRKPKVLEYKLDNTGIHIGGKLYMYDRFKSFSVIHEGALNSIHLSPLGRIAPPLSLYYPPDQEEQIVNMLANYLPHEERSHDPVDRLMRRIRF